MKIKAKKKLQLSSEFNQALVPLSYRVTPIHAVIVQWVGSNLIWWPITYCLHKWGPIKVRRDWQQPCISSHVILSLWYHYDEKVIGFRANTIYASFSLRVLNLKTCDFRVHVCHFFFPQLYMCKREGFSRVRKSSLSTFASPPINCARNSNEEEAEFFLRKDNERVFHCCSTLAETPSQSSNWADRLTTARQTLTLDRLQSMRGTKKNKKRKMQFVFEKKIEIKRGVLV